MYTPEQIANMVAERAKNEVEQDVEKEKDHGQR